MTLAIVPAIQAEPATARRRRLRAIEVRARILLCGGFVFTAASTPAGAWRAFAGYGVLLVGLLALAGASWRATGGRLLRLLPFLAVVCLPVGWLTPPPGVSPGLEVAGWPGAGLAVTLALKACLGLGGLLLLGALATGEELLAGLARLGLPRAVCTQLFLTWRYGAVLREEAARMQVAYAARGGRRRWLWQARGVGQLIGALFVRSGERAERVHQAMLARGFDGVSLAGAGSQPGLGRWGAAEWAWLLGVGLALAAVRGVWW